MQNLTQMEPILLLDSNRGIHIYAALLFLAKKWGYDEPDDFCTINDNDMIFSWLNDEGRTRHPEEENGPGYYEENEEGIWFFPMEPEPDNESGPGFYHVTVQHDKGRARIKTFASSKQAASAKVQAAENCPESAIKNIKPA